MDRVYENPTNEAVRFFIGEEVENTPAKGLKTLFVVGSQPLTEVIRLYKEHNCENLYLGANQSYFCVSLEQWKDMVIYCRENIEGYITFDYPVTEHQKVYECFGSETLNMKNFIPMLSVAIPHIYNSGTLLTIKIDDIGFDKTNVGVWCHSVYDVTKTNDPSYTTWKKYSQDKII